MMNILSTPLNVRRSSINSFSESEQSDHSGDEILSGKHTCSILFSFFQQSCLPVLLLCDFITSYA